MIRQASSGPLPDICGRHSPCGLELPVPGTALESDKASVAEVVGRLEDAVVMDLARAGLVPARMVRKLEVADMLPAISHPAAEIAFGYLHMVEIPVDLDAWRIYLFADANSRWASVKGVPFMINPDIHRLKDHDDPMTLGNRSSKLEPGNDVGVHLFLGHPRLVISADNRHETTAQFLCRPAGGLDSLHEGFVVLRIIKTGLETPGGKLGHLDFQFPGFFGNGSQVFSLEGPEFYGWKSQCCRRLDSLQEWKLRKPHLDVHSKACVWCLPDAGVVFGATGGLPARHPERGGRTGRRGAKKFTSGWSGQGNLL